MTLSSIFITVLNLAYCIILPWFLYYAYKEYKYKRAAAGQIFVYDPARLIPHKPLFLVTALYAATVTVLWLLFMFRISDVIETHWFSYVYILVLPVLINQDRVRMFIGPYGVSLNGNLIPWSDITHYEFKEFNALTNRWILEIQTKDRIERGVVPSESKPEIKELLEEHAVRLRPVADLL